MDTRIIKTTKCKLDKTIVLQIAKITETNRNKLRIKLIVIRQIETILKTKLLFIKVNLLLFY